MRTFRELEPGDLREAVAEWSELLAKGRFAEALEMFPPAERDPMSAEELEEWLSNYGDDRPKRNGRRWRVTTLLDRPDAREIIQRISVELGVPQSWDAETYLGFVEYADVPLNGERSDLTARFAIKRVPGGVTLEFRDVFVM